MNMFTEIRITFTDGQYLKVFVLDGHTYIESAYETVRLPKNSIDALQTMLNTLRYQDNFAPCTAIGALAAEKVSAPDVVRDVYPYPDDGMLF